jgi:hypothetical protein
MVNTILAKGHPPTWHTAKNSSFLHVTAVHQILSTLFLCLGKTTNSQDRFPVIHKKIILVFKWAFEFLMRSAQTTYQFPLFLGIQIMLTLASSQFPLFAFPVAPGVALDIKGRWLVQLFHNTNTADFPVCFGMRKVRRCLPFLRSAFPITFGNWKCTTVDQ